MYVGLDAVKLEIIKKLNTLNPLKVGDRLYTLKKTVAENDKITTLLMGCGATLANIEELPAEELYELLTQLFMVIALVIQLCVRN
jgi:hypothetical protein